MRIVHIATSDVPVFYRFGGAIQRRIREIGRVQKRRGHHVVVYSCAAGGRESIEEDLEVREITCSRSGALRHIEFQIKAMLDLRRTYGAVDVIHSHSQPEAGLIFGRSGGKKVLSFDYFEFRRGRRTPLFHLYRTLLGRFDVLLPVSEYCKQGFLSYWRLERAKAQVLPNGVNTEQFRPSDALRAREKQSLGTADRVVLFVGRVCEQKGTDILLDAFQQVGERCKNAQLVIAGPIARFGGLEDVALWTNRIGSVGGIYLGPVEEERLAGVYNLADVFVMPTRELEMFGMAAVEAQACAKPVVASDHGGLREVVPESCGARFPVGDANALANEIVGLLDDSERYARSSRNALRNAERYEWGRIADELDRLYG